MSNIKTHDLFVYPSLHDSSGNAVLEALSFGLPVVCLDLGGPAQIVTPDAGAIVSTAGRDTTQVAAAMAAEILRVLSSPELLKELSHGAVDRAAQFALADRVTQFYEMVESVVSDAAGALGELLRRCKNCRLRSPMSRPCRAGG